MSYESEKNLINELLETNSPRSLYGIIKNNYNSLYIKIESLETIGGFTEKLYMFLHNFKEVPMCKECKENPVKFIAWKSGFRIFCSSSCQTKYTHKQVPKSVRDYNEIHGTNFTNVAQLPEVIKKRNKTMMEKYGTTMPVNDHYETIKKREATSMKRYGVKNAAHADSVRKKAQQTMRDKSAEEKEATQTKWRETCEKRYGVSNPMKDKVIYDKAKQTRLEKYGVEHYLQDPELAKVVNEKARNTMRIKYGSSTPMDAPGAKEKFKETSLIHFGTEHPMQNKEVQQKQHDNAMGTLVEKYNVKNSMQVPGAMEKRKQTCLSKYGFEFAQQNDAIREKVKKTMLERYGVCNSILIPGNLEKVLKNHYSRKEYVWKNGEISSVQGYEPIVLQELENSGYRFDEILTSPKDMPEIIYWLNGKEHRYYPDIFIPKENLIIEVKSEYTLKKEWDKNQAKFKAVKALGFEFRLEVR